MICLNKEKQEPLYLQIYSQIVKEIMEGILKEGEVLQGSRSLARTLQVSRNTVDNAYNQLAAEGYICAKKGIGYIVMALPRLEISRENKTSEKHFNKKKDMEMEKENILYDLTNSSHTNDLFPKTLWKKYTLESMELLDNEKRLSSYQDKQGEFYLRQNLLTYLERIRGVNCREEQIIITAGIQQSLDYLCKIIQGDKTVIMEEPGYNKAAAVFMNNNIKVVTVAVDQKGLKVKALSMVNNVSAVYTTPSHQFPTGVTMPVGRRYELLEWAQKTNTYIIEDDFDSEQRYYAKPIPSLQSVDNKNKVIYLGTFSKALSPSIRMGYMILPPALLEIYYKKFENYNSTVPLLNQYVIGKMIETGQYDRHIRRLNSIFRKRLEVFREEFSDVEDKIKIFENGTGQYFLLEFSEKVDQIQLITKAKEQGVQVYSTMQFWRDKADCPPNTLFLGFSKIDLKDIPDCVSRLKEAWKEWL